MIAKLTGIIDSIYESKLVLEVGGIGYEVSVPAPLLGAIKPGDDMALYIHESTPQDSAPVLYGFITRHDKDLFSLLTTVQGVGPKAAMAILSIAPADKIVGAVLSGDVALVSTANGVGAKIAARVVAELKDKIGKIGIAAQMDEISGQVKESKIASDAISALVNLGYQRAETTSIVHSVLAKDSSLDTPAVIRQALAKFS